jgi:parallel beta-helix repeat protein
MQDVFAGILIGTLLVSFSPPAQAAPPEKSLSISGPAQITAGDCTPVTITASYAGKKAVQGHTGVVVLNVLLTTQGSGSFFGDDACANAITEVAINSTIQNATVYFRDTLVENSTLKAKDAAGQFVGTAMSLAVDPGPPANIAFTAQPETYATGCGIGLSASPAVQVKDAFGNSTEAPTLTLTAFNDPECQSPASGALAANSTPAGDTVTFSNLSYTGFDGGPIFLGTTVSGANVACSNAVTLVGLASPTAFNTCVMTGTLEPASGATLDCQGQTLVPSVLGGSPPAPGVYAPPSVPETAIVLHDEAGATIRNCNLQNFDNGVIMLRANDNNIVNNTISVRGLGIYAMDANGNQITGNKIFWSNTTGKGVHLDSLTDSNTISRNTLTDTGSAGSFNMRMTVPTFPGAPVVIKDQAIFVLGVYMQTATAYSNGVAYQVNAVADPNAYTRQSATNNVVSENTIQGAIRISGGSRNTVVSGNALRGNSSLIGITETSATGVVVSLPGKCKLDQSRFCYTEMDCAFPGLDFTDLGPCGPSPGQVTVVGGSWNNQYVDNSIIGPWNIGIQTAGHYTVINSNKILPNDNGTAATGISWAGSRTIMHNSVVAKTAMMITINNNAGPYEAALTNVSLNDFTRYTTAVQMPVPSPTAPWTFNPTYFSSGGLGNYWGLPCDVSTGFDTTKVTNVPKNFVIKDNHPFGVPVADTPPNQLPATCQ